MPRETILYRVTTSTTQTREHGAAPTGSGLLDLNFSPAALRSILTLLASCVKWYCVLRYRKGFRWFDSVRLGLWLARGES